MSAVYLQCKVRNLMTERISQSGRWSERSQHRLTNSVAVTTFHNKLTQVRAYFDRYKSPYTQPETVPQACIDMNSVLEVAGAEEITGNAFSLAITAQDNVHFVKGTSREEARFWTDVLSVFPRSKPFQFELGVKTSCHNRNFVLEWGPL
ncbi:hypothetical protein AAG570_000912 [Ranatra chinensis]|uniref:PH domain-containing protein n=1 Tax=Ranatra chinensis TaxID=642074 RepID=A0ABD0YYG1_9HEMI